MTFTGQVSIPNGINIYGSSFAKENPDTMVFSPSMTGVTFYDCNLDNVFIPPGNTVVGGTQRRYLIQNDLNDWLVTAQNIPTMPLNFEAFQQYNLPIPLPINIPLQRVAERIDLLALALAAQQAQIISN